MRILVLAISASLSFGAFAGGVAGKGHSGCEYSAGYQAANDDAPKVTMDSLIADADATKVQPQAVVEKTSNAPAQATKTTTTAVRPTAASQ